MTAWGNNLPYGKDLDGNPATASVEARPSAPLSHLDRMVSNPALQDGFLDLNLDRVR